MSETVIGRDELLNGVQVKIVTREIELPAGTWERGMLLGKYNGAYDLIGEVNYGADTFDCILTEDVTLSETGKGTAYFAGEFKESLLIVKDAGIATIEEVKDNARKLQIYFN
jgi:hypothetical protein